MLKEECEFLLIFFKKRFGKEVYGFCFVGDVFMLRRKKENKTEICIVSQKLDKHSPWF